MTPLRIERLEDRTTPTAVPYVLDPSFGSGGVAFVTPINASAKDATLAADGDVLVLGANGLAVPTLARLNGDGTPDGTFDPTGALAVLAQRYTATSFERVVSQPDGRVLLAGAVALPSGGGSAFVARLTATGELDATFGDGGQALVAPQTSLGSVGVLSSGQVIVIARGAGGAVDVYRLTAAGQPDPTYGSGGQTRLANLGDLAAHFGTAQVLADGAVVVTGTRVTAFTDSATGEAVRQVFATADRLTSGGQPEPAFGADGHAEAVVQDLRGADIPFLSQFGAAGGPFQSAVVQPNGGVVVGEVLAAPAAAQAGIPPGKFSPTAGVFVMTRFDQTGRADPTFGTAGAASLNLFNGETLVGSAVQLSVVELVQLPDGTLEVLGSIATACGERPPALFQYTPSGQPKPLVGASNRYALPPTSAGGFYQGAVLALIDAAGRQLIVARGNATTNFQAPVARLIGPSSPLFPAAAPTLLVSGSAGQVRAVQADGTVRPKAATFAGGVPLATADLDGNGIDDEIYGSGPGGGSRVLVHLNFDPKTAAPARQADFAFDAFEPTFAGGVTVVAADLDNDGRLDLVVTPGDGGSGRVQVYTFAGASVVAKASGAADPLAPRTLVKTADFFGIDDPNFRGGATATAADLDGDGVKELIVAAGVGGGPRVAVFAGATLHSAGVGLAPPKLMNDFFAFGGEDAARLRNGVSVAAADLNADGRDDLIFGGGKGGAPRVFAADGGQLFASGGTAFAPLANFFVANDSQSRGGVQLVARDLDGDGRFDLAANVAGQPIRVYDGRAVALVPGQEPPLLAQIDVFADAHEIGTVFVG